MNDNKPQAKIALIGHVDHGKTSLAAAVQKMLAEKSDEDFASPDCSGCGGGEKVPANVDWNCPVCGAQWYSDES